MILTGLSVVGAPIAVDYTLTTLGIRLTAVQKSAGTIGLGSALSSGSASLIQGNSLAEAADSATAGFDQGVMTGIIATSYFGPQLKAAGYGLSLAYQSLARVPGALLSNGKQELQSANEKGTSFSWSSFSANTVLSSLWGGATNNPMLAKAGVVRPGVVATDMSIGQVAIAGTWTGIHQLAGKAIANVDKLTNSISSSVQGLYNSFSAPRTTITRPK